MIIPKQSIKFIGQVVAQNIDVVLMSEGQYRLNQLMELAGFAVAQAVYKVYCSEHPKSILLVVGPGNNGGDALVAARHLFHFGCRPSLHYPKKPKNELYEALFKQCLDLGIEEVDLASGIQSAEVIVDGIFGFSFKGAVRAPFDTILQALKQATKPIASIDIPSGWDVEHGNKTGEGLEPELLISLTAPKECAKQFKGRCHYLGCRFIPPHIGKRFEIPLYHEAFTQLGTDQVIQLETDTSL